MEMKIISDNGNERKSRVIGSNSDFGRKSVKQGILWSFFLLNLLEQLHYHTYFNIYTCNTYRHKMSN